MGEKCGFVRCVYWDRDGAAGGWAESLFGGAGVDGYGCDHADDWPGRRLAQRKQTMSGIFASIFDKQEPEKRDMNAVIMEARRSNADSAAGSLTPSSSMRMAAVYACV